MIDFSNLPRWFELTPEFIGNLWVLELAEDAVRQGIDFLPLEKEAFDDFRLQECVDANVDELLEVSHRAMLANFHRRRNDGFKVEMPALVFNDESLGFESKVLQSVPLSVKYKPHSRQAVWVSFHTVFEVDDETRSELESLYRGYGRNTPLARWKSAVRDAGYEFSHSSYGSACISVTLTRFIPESTLLAWLRLPDNHLQFHRLREMAFEVEKLGEDFKKDVEESRNSRGACFIATAVYGSYDSPEVMTLRRFRDERLAVSRPGRAFIRWYYKAGPWLASRLNETSSTSRAVRWILDRFVAQLDGRMPKL